MTRDETKIALAPIVLPIHSLRRPALSMRYIGTKVKKQLTAVAAHDSQMADSGERTPDIFMIVAVKYLHVLYTRLNSHHRSAHERIDASELLEQLQHATKDESSSHMRRC